MTSNAVSPGSDFIALCPLLIPQAMALSWTRPLLSSSSWPFPHTTPPPSPASPLPPALSVVHLGWIESPLLSLPFVRPWILRNLRPPSQAERTPEYPSPLESQAKQQAGYGSPALQHPDPPSQVEQPPQQTPPGEHSTEFRLEQRKGKGREHGTGQSQEHGRQEGQEVTQGQEQRQQEGKVPVCESPAGSQMDAVGSTREQRLEVKELSVFAFGDAWAFRRALRIVNRLTA